MPKIVKTITNNNPAGIKPWIFPEDYSKHFTTNEIETILTPYFDYVQSLTGFVGTTQEEIGDTLVVKLEFDTMENLNAAESVLQGANPHSIVKTRMDLLKNKLTELGAESTFTHHVE